MAWGRLILAFAGGAIASSNWPHSGLAWLPYLAGLLLAFITYLLFKPSTRSVAWALIAACLGAAWFAYAATQADHNMLSPSCDGSVVSADGEVLSASKRVNERGDSQWRLSVRLEDSSISDCFVSKNPVANLSWWSSAYAKGHPKKIAPGDKLSATIKLRRPHSSLNPYGFDYVAWLWRKDVQASGYIKTLTSYQSNSPNTADSHRSRIHEVLDQHPAKPVLLTLLLGERSEMSPALWQQARETGIAHLFAISGLHLGLLVAAVLFLTVTLFRGFPKQSGWSRFWLMAPAVGAATAYAAIAGWPLSAQRALLMLMLVWLAYAWHWRVPVFTAWATALGLVLLWQPLAVLDGGFYLSFAAVAILLWVAPRKWPNRAEMSRAQRGSHMVLLACRLQLALLIGLLPLQWWLFGGFSLLSLPLNLLLVPLFAVFLMPALFLVAIGFALALPGAEAALLLLADVFAWLLGLLQQLHEQTSGSAIAWQVLGRPSPIQMLLLGFAVLLLLLPRALSLRAVGFTLLAVGYAAVLHGDVRLTDDGSYQVTSFDVGQGTAVLIETSNHRLIYDTGPSWRSGNSAMQSMVLPSLALMGIGRIDKVLLSHDDNDHDGGLSVLLAQYPTTDVFGTPDQPCLKGQVWDWDGVRFEVLSPQMGLNDSNQQSCVLKVTSRFGSSLLTGDITRRVERNLLAQEDIVADWLLVPHHGSKTSSHQSFINAVSADTAVITSGHNNHYGLPAAEVVARYKAQHQLRVLFNTAEDGAVSSLFNSGCSPCNQSEKQRRRWWQRLEESN